MPAKHSSGTRRPRSASRFGHSRSWGGRADRCAGHRRGPRRGDRGRSRMGGPRRPCRQGGRPSHLPRTASARDPDQCRVNTGGTEPGPARQAQRPSRRRPGAEARQSRRPSASALHQCVIPPTASGAGTAILVDGRGRSEAAGSGGGGAASRDPLRPDRPSPRPGFHRVILLSSKNFDQESTARSTTSMKKIVWPPGSSISRREISKPRLNARENAPP